MRACSAGLAQSLLRAGSHVQFKLPQSRVFLSGLRAAFPLPLAPTRARAQLRRSFVQHHHRRHRHPHGSSQYRVVVVCTVAAAAAPQAVLHHLPSFIAHAVTKAGRQSYLTLPSIINLRHLSLLSSLELFCLLRLTAIYPSIPLSKYAVMLSFAPGCPNIT